MKKRRFGVDFGRFCRNEGISVAVTTLASNTYYDFFISMLVSSPLVLIPHAHGHGHTPICKTSSISSAIVVSCQSYESFWCLS